MKNFLIVLALFWHCFAFGQITDLGRTAQDRVRPSFFNQNTNADTTAQGINLHSTIPISNLDNTAVISKVLTGLNTSMGSPVVATDSILSAFGKLEFRMLLNDAKLTGADRVLRSGDTMSGPLDVPFLRTDGLQIRGNNADTNRIWTATDSLGNGFWQDIEALLGSPEAVNEINEQIQDQLFGGGQSGQQFLSTFENAILFTEGDDNSTGQFVGGSVPFANDILITELHGNVRVSSTTSGTTVTLQVNGTNTTNTVTFPSGGGTDVHVDVTNVNFAVPAHQHFRMLVTAAPAVLGQQAKDVNIYVKFRHTSQTLPPVPINESFQFNTASTTPEIFSLAILKSGNQATINWGDASTSTTDPFGAAVTHTYASGGVKAIQLIATDGLSSVQSFLISQGGRGTNSLPSLAKLSGLVAFQISSNDFSGTFPPLTNNAQLATLAISSNRFSGTFPSLSSNNNLVILRINNNQFSGAFQSGGKTNWATIQDINISSNGFTGAVPSFTHVPSLTNFNISSNGFTSMDATFSNVQNLRVYNDSFNSISGELTPIQSNLGLEYYIANDNQYSTVLSAQWQGKTNLQRIFLHNNLFAQSAIDDHLRQLLTNATLRVTGQPTAFVRLDGTGNAAPSGAGLTNRNALTEKGWSVLVNTPSIHGTALTWSNNVVANGGTVSAATVQAASELMYALDEIGVTGNIKRLNIVAGDNLNAALVPLIRSGGNAVDANTGFVGGDYSEAVGLTGNGSKFLDTGLAVSQAMFTNGSLGIFANGMQLAQEPTEIFSYMGAASGGDLWYLSSGLSARHFTRGDSSEELNDITIEPGVSGTNGFYVGGSFGTNIYLSHNGDLVATAPAVSSTNINSSIKVFKADANSEDPHSMTLKAYIITDVNIAGFGVGNFDDDIYRALRQFEFAVRAGGEIAAWESRVNSAGGSLSLETKLAAQHYMRDVQPFRASVKRVNLFAGDNLTAATVPIVADAGPNLDTNFNFVASDYVERGSTGGLKGDGSTKYWDTGTANAQFTLTGNWVGFYASELDVYTGTGSGHPFFARTDSGVGSYGIANIPGGQRAFVAGVGVPQPTIIAPFTALASDSITVYFNETATVSAANVFQGGNLTASVNGVTGIGLPTGSLLLFKSGNPTAPNSAMRLKGYYMILNDGDNGATQFHQAIDEFNRRLGRANN